VFFSDVRHLLEIFLQIWFWLTPIIYPVEFVPERFQTLYRLNPAVMFVESYRNSLLYNQPLSGSTLISLFLVSAVFLLIGYVIFNGYNRRFAEEI